MLSPKGFRLSRVALVCASVIWLLTYAAYWARTHSYHNGVLTTPLRVIHVGRSSRPRTVRAIIQQNHDHLYLVDINNQEGQALLAAPRRDSHFYIVSARPAIWTWGFVGPAIRTTNHTMHIYARNPPSPLAETDVTACRNMFADFIASQGAGDPEIVTYVNLLRKGDGYKISFDVRYVVLDLIALIALGYLIYAIVGHIRRRQVQRDLRNAGRCHACGYDMTGILGRCPECGATRVAQRSIARRSDHESQ